MNKRGNIFVPIIFVGILFLVLFAGFLMATGGAVINWVFDEAVPELSNLGVVGETNLTEVASYTLTPINTVVQTSTWMTGVLYVLLLLGSIMFAVSIRFSGSKWLMGFYIALVLLLILASIFVSNMYQDIHDGTNEIALQLQEQSLLSFFILYSPAIFSFIAFITAIIMFSGIQEEEFG